MLGLPFPDIWANEYGKPYFDNGDGSGFPYFSISHAYGYAACAISKVEIGCDIEKIQRVPRILDKELAKAERLVPGAADDEHGRTLRWTVYEALAKCIGTGIPLQEPDIDAFEWRSRTWDVHDSHVLSIVAYPEGAQGGSHE